MSWTSRSTAYLRRKNRRGGRGRIHKKKGYVFQARRQQPAKLQSLSSFLRGGQFKAFPLGYRLLFYFLFFFWFSCYCPPATSKETCPGVYVDTVPRCLGWAASLLLSGVPFHFAMQIHLQLTGYGEQVFLICHKRISTHSNYILLFHKQIIHDQYPYHCITKYVHIYCMS